MSSVSWALSDSHRLISLKPASRLIMSGCSGRRVQVGGRRVTVPDTCNRVINESNAHLAAAILPVHNHLLTLPTVHWYCTLSGSRVVWTWACPFWVHLTVSACGITVLRTLLCFLSLYNVFINECTENNQAHAFRIQANKDLIWSV